MMTSEALYYSGLGGGRTRTRTLDPLIKSVRITLANQGVIRHFRGLYPLCRINELRSRDGNLRY